MKPIDALIYLRAAVAGFLCLAGTLAMPHPSTAMEAEESQQLLDDMDSLVIQADTIVLARVTRIKQDLESTVVSLYVDKVFKGAPGQTLELIHDGGKHTVKPEEPSFMSYDRAILYLIKDGPLYRCLNGSEGKKTIVNDNVYLHPTNNFLTMRLKKYEETLTKKIAARAQLPVQP